MNTLATKKTTIKTMKTDGIFKRHGGQGTTPCSILGAALLMLFSANALADRPAMEERLDDGIEATINEREIAENKAREEQASKQQTPAEPSAVEVMMQTQQQQTRQVQQTQTSGDVIQLAPTEMQSGETIKVKLMDEPRRGMNMDKVQQMYGQPLATTAGVGTPPISSWTYSDRTVYFEYATVLHVVAR